MERSCKATDLDLAKRYLRTEQGILHSEAPASESSQQRVMKTALTEGTIGCIESKLFQDLTGL